MNIYQKYDTLLESDQWDEAYSKLNSNDKNIVNLIIGSISQELSRYKIYLGAYVQPLHRIDDTAWGDFGTDSLSDDGNYPGGDYIILELRFAELDEDGDDLYEFLSPPFFLYHQLSNNNKRVVDRIFKRYLPNHYCWNLDSSRPIIIN